MSKPSDLVQGTLDLLILKILALEPLNGWAISQRLRQVSGDVLQVSDGSLYPALHKLEQEGWISAEWKREENNRRAKFYSLTRPGRGISRARAGQLGAPLRRDLARRQALRRRDMARAARLYDRPAASPLAVPGYRVEHELDDELRFHVDSRSRSRSRGA